MNVNSQRASLRLDLATSHIRQKERPLLTYGLLASTPIAIDPRSALSVQSWFHGQIGKLDAEKLLRDCRPGTYLVRQSDVHFDDYALVVKCVRGYLHIKIQTHSNDQVMLGSDRKPFCSIPEMVDYYSRNRLPIKGAEHMALLFPLNEQLL